MQVSRYSDGWQLVKPRLETILTTASSIRLNGASLDNMNSIKLNSRNKEFKFDLNRRIFVFLLEGLSSIIRRKNMWSDITITIRKINQMSAKKDASSTGLRSKLSKLNDIDMKSVEKKISQKSWLDFRLGRSRNLNLVKDALEAGTKGDLKC